VCAGDAYALVRSRTERDAEPRSPGHTAPIHRANAGFVRRPGILNVIADSGAVGRGGGEGGRGDRSAAERAGVLPGDRSADHRPDGGRPGDRAAAKVGSAAHAGARWTGADGLGVPVLAGGRDGRPVLAGRFDRHRDGCDHCLPAPQYPAVRRVRRLAHRRQRAGPGVQDAGRTDRTALGVRSAPCRNPVLPVRPCGAWCGVSADDGRVAEPGSVAPDGSLGDPDGACAGVRRGDRHGAARLPLAHRLHRGLGARRPARYRGPVRGGAAPGRRDVTCRCDRALSGPRHASPGAVTRRPHPATGEAGIRPRGVRLRRTAAGSSG
jgi:hypothetical protein